MASPTKKGEKPREIAFEPHMKIESEPGHPTPESMSSPTTIAGTNFNTE